MKDMIRIIGIDPGLRRTGWGIIESLGNSLRFVASGTVTSDGDMDLASRLCQLHDGLADVIHTYQPHEAAVEQTFVNKDAVATLKLGQARGIAMLVPARAGLRVAEYAPNAVKKSVIGVGPRRKTADPHDVESPHAQGRIQGQRRRRRARHRHLPRPQSRRDRKPAGDAGWVMFLTCSVGKSISYFDT